LRARTGEVDQAIGVGNRQRRKQDLVEQRVDPGVRADPQPERQDGDDRHERGFEQRAERELETANGGMHCRMG